MKSLNALDWLALVLVVVGGLNWGLIALAETDLVALLFGTLSPITRLVYGLVGLAAVYLAVISPSLHRRDRDIT